MGCLTHGWSHRHPRACNRVGYPSVRVGDTTLWIGINKLGEYDLAGPYLSWADRSLDADTMEDADQLIDGGTKPLNVGLGIFQGL